MGRSRIRRGPQSLARDQLRRNGVDFARCDAKISVLCMMRMGGGGRQTREER
jgi:hypothetical protein